MWPAPRTSAFVPALLLVALVLPASAFSEDATQRAAGPRVGEETNKNDQGMVSGRVALAGASGTESVAAKTLELKLDSDAFKYHFTLCELDGHPVDEVRLTAEPFIDDNGMQHVPEWRIGEADPAATPSRSIVTPLAALERKVVVLSASLPSLGQYRTTLIPWWGGQSRQHIELKVERIRPTLNVAIEEASVFAQVGNTDTVAFTLNLRETQDKPAVLHVPTLASLTQQLGPDAKASALGWTANLVVTEENKALQPSESIQLARSAAKEIGFRLERFPGPGKYEAKLRFTAPGAVPLDKSVTLYVRYHWPVATVLIALGVLVSFLLRWWVGQEKPRLELLHSAARLERELQRIEQLQKLDDVEQGVVKATRSLLAALIVDIVEEQQSGSAAEVELMSRRVNVVSNLLVLRSWIRDTDGLAGPSALSKLDDILAELRGSKLTLERANELLEALKEIRTRHREAVAVDEALRTALPVVTDPTKKRALEVDVAQFLRSGDVESARSRIETAKREAAATQPNPGRRMNLGSSGTPTAPSASAPVAAEVVAPEIQTALKLAAHRLSRRSRLEWLINGIILVIAVLLGMKALYLDDLTWGGPGTLLVALLWGVGLHQFAYSGIGGLIDKVSTRGSNP